jgi:hypothetical protein
MVSINFLSFLAVLTWLPFSSTGLPPNKSKSHFAKTSSACDSNLFRSKIQTTATAPPTTHTGASQSLFATAAGAVPLPDARDVETKLPGIWWSSAKNRYDIDLDWALVKGAGFWRRVVAGFKFFFFGDLVKLLKTIYASYFRSIPITIYDARAMEAQEGLSKADFFDKYGFVIFNSKSAMTADGWEESNRDQQATLKEYGNRAQDGGAAYNKRMDTFRNADTPVKRIYAEEVKELIQTILPRVKTIMPPAQGIRRSVVGGIFNGPAKVVHNDYGVDFEEVTRRNPFFDFEKQKAKYDETKSNEFMLINFWRPIKPMSDKPLRSLPLCFLDASTLSEDDMVAIDQKSLGIAMALKYNPNHKFYYYPDMTVDEVVVFKQFHNVRNDTEARMPVFHTAFPDPAADENTEGRVSFEYRVGLLA